MKYQRSHCRTAYVIVSRYLAGETEEQLAEDYVLPWDTICLVIASAEYCTRTQREKLRRKAGL